MRRFAALIFLALLTGCTSASYDLAALAPEDSSAAGSPRFSDNDPHEWQGRTPWSYEVHGIDVAKYQEDVDWRRVAANGIAFAYMKATEGGDRVDEYFARNWRRAKTAGLPRGAYHFYYFCRPAIEQARWFIRHVPRDPAALPPVLDIEWTPFSPTCTRRPEPSKVRAEMRTFLEALERHYGKRPVIYTTIDFFNDNDLQRFDKYPFWLHSVAGHPDDRYDGHPWLFWQYTGTGVVPGIDGDTDINVFYGDAKDWREWLETPSGRIARPGRNTTRTNAGGGA